MATEGSHCNVTFHPKSTDINRMQDAIPEKPACYAFMPSIKACSWIRFLCRPSRDEHVPILSQDILDLFARKKQMLLVHCIVRQIRRTRRAISHGRATCDGLLGLPRFLMKQLEPTLGYIIL